ncbi:MAG: L,D-transpeptidase family protein [Flavobacteriaceae bacterium]|nr:L,D-transpeptidase family protein [Flavobacteriaceae bacterium]
MKKTLFYTSIFLLFISCAKDLKKEAPLVVKTDYKKELHDFFKANFGTLDSAQVINDVSISFAPQINEFYNKIDHKPIWINDSIEYNETALRFIDRLTKADEYGLISSLYGLPLLHEVKRQLTAIDHKEERFRIASEIEVLLTNWYLLFGKHLHYGVLDSIDSITVLPRKKFDLNLSEHLLASYKANNVIGGLFELQPKHQQYKKLQLKLKDFIAKSSLSTDNIFVQNFRIDSLKAMSQAKKALVLHRYLDTVFNDSIYVESLKQFQRDHGLKDDGLVGKNTAQALSKSPYEYYQALVVNLERWRWKVPFPNDYLMVNIPGFDLKVYENNQFRFKHRTIVGKTKTPTPEMRDSLKTIIAYPYWYVPKKISLEEILVKAQKDSTYFQRNNFEVITYQKDSVDYHSLNWKEINEGKFNYLVRQAGGSANSLGLVKFIFPNKYAIYLHDTPSMHLFGKEKRAYSHGCVRVEGSLKLADYLLEYDQNKMTIDSVRYYIKSHEEKPIRLNKRLPIFLYYFTATVNENDELIFYNDIYNLDKRILQRMYMIHEKNKVKSAKKLAQH